MDCSKDDILKRLRRIEGQIKGIQKMVDSEQCCNDILVQVAAVRAAINKVGGLILENYSKTCVRKALVEDSKDENIEELIETIIKYTK